MRMTPLISAIHRKPLNTHFFEAKPENVKLLTNKSVIMSLPQTLRDLVCPAPHKRERRKEARPGELLDAALALFVEKGYAATKVEEVAQRAGVSKGTLFLYFASKEELFKAVVRQNISGNFSEFNTALDEFEGSTADLLRIFVHAWWDRIAASQGAGIIKLMVSEGAQFPELADFYRVEVVEPGSQLIRRVLDRGTQRSEFRLLDPNYGFYAVLAPIMFVELWKNAPHLSGADGLSMNVSKYLDMQIDILLNGLSLQPPANFSS
jgi:AcrR family transcriptional regulator